MKNGLQQYKSSRTKDIFNSTNVHHTIHIIITITLDTAKLSQSHQAGHEIRQLTLYNLMLNYAHTIHK
jgi:uncharacterized ubiquitin-like protein YukD